MANKFTKSVLERQAKEQKVRLVSEAAADRQSESAPIAIIEETVTPEDPLENPAPVRTKKPAAAPIPDLTAFIVKEEGRAAKNKTFYLDAAVIDALHRAAAAQKITDSKLVNDILKKLLGI